MLASRGGLGRRLSIPTPPFRRRAGAKQAGSKAHPGQRIEGSACVGGQPVSADVPARLGWEGVGVTRPAPRRHGGQRRAPSVRPSRPTGRWNQMEPKGTVDDDCTLRFCEQTYRNRHPPGEEPAEGSVPQVGSSCRHRRRCLRQSSMAAIGCRSARRIGSRPRSVRGRNSNAS